MRFHVPALPGRETTRENSTCAYTQKVRRFCTMMREAGHEVFLYGGGRNDARASAYVACYPDTGPLEFEVGLWVEPNLRAAAEIQARKQPGDFLCLIAGLAQKQIADAHPDLQCVEYGVGYGGVFAPYKVFESYAWMHSVYAQHSGDAHSVDGAFYDTVIPNYFEPEEFPFGEWEREDSLLYLGRMLTRKGVEVAEKTAEALQMPLILAGPEGDYTPSYGNYIGPVGPETRAELLGRARALLAPTLYVEPFGGAAVEAMMCGTPAITTDWGAYTETVLHGTTGFRCRTLGEFVWAVEHVGELDLYGIRQHAVANYSVEAIQPRYETYFEQLATLWGEGWNSRWEGLSKTHRYGLLNPA